MSPLYSYLAGAGHISHVRANTSGGEVTYWTCNLCSQPLSVTGTGLADEGPETVKHRDGCIVPVFVALWEMKDYALDRLGAIGIMSAWTDSTLNDAGGEARAAVAEIRKRLAPLLEEPEAVL